MSVYEARMQIYVTDREKFLRLMGQLDGSRRVPAELKKLLKEYGVLSLVVRDVTDTHIEFG